MNLRAISLARLAPFLMLTLGACTAGVTADGPSSELATGLSAAASVYDNGALVAPWYDGSWTTHTLNSTSVLYNGKHTLSVTFQPWAALALDNDSGVAPGTNDTLSFYVYGGTNTKPNLSAVLYVNNQNWGPTVSIAPYCDGGFIPSNAWAHCSVPLSALGGATKSFSEIAIEEGAGKNLAAMALSTIQLVSSGSTGGGAVDAGTDSGSPADAGGAGGKDAGPKDAGGSDSGLHDAGAKDAAPDSAVPPSDAGANGQWVMGYYVGYSINSYPIAQIDWSGLTHIIFAPMTVNSDLSLNLSFDDENGTGQADAQALAAAAHAHGVKALLMLGGQGDTNVGTAATAANRAAFVTKLVSAVTTLGYDGIDLDWEENLNLVDLTSLAQALRAARPSMVITYPSGAINGNYQTVDPQLVTLAKSLDRFNVQTYYPSTATTGSGWDSWFNSPLSGVTGSTPIAIDDTLQRFATAGIPKAKLGMGMSFYAICYTGGITGPRQATTSSTQILGGDNSYPLSAFFASGSTFDKSSTAERKRDSAAQVPFLSLTTATNDTNCGAATQYLSYDDETSIIAKGTFSKGNGYGGIMIWTLQEGWLPANASGGRAPNALMEALKTGFLN